MASLACMDTYLQSLGRRVCARERAELPKRPKAPVSGIEGALKKKKKKPRRLKQDGGAQRAPVTPPRPLPPEAPPTSFSTVDLLRKRLYEKIEESRTQVSNKSLSAEAITKIRQKRKQERERKKRKRKELRRKAAEEEEAAAEVEGSASVKPEDEDVEEKPVVPIIFNKVKVHDEQLNKAQLKKEKKERVKGSITPMTGRNYKQLLERLEARKSKLEQLQARDQNKAQEYQDKIKWTNALYKAEGLKIKDDEGMLKTALKCKEKQREQRKKRWDARALQTCQKMQQRQDKRTRNINKKKRAKREKRKNRARKKGRVLPEDLAKAK